MIYSDGCDDILLVRRRSRPATIGWWPARALMRHHVYRTPSRRSQRLGPGATATAAQRAVQGHLVHIAGHVAYDILAAARWSEIDCRGHRREAVIAAIADLPGPARSLGARGPISAISADHRDQRWTYAWDDDARRISRLYVRSEIDAATIRCRIGQHYRDRLNFG